MSTISCILRFFVNIFDSEGPPLRSHYTRILEEEIFVYSKSLYRHDEVIIPAVTVLYFKSLGNFLFSVTNLKLGSL